MQSNIYTYDCSTS